MQQKTIYPGNICLNDILNKKSSFLYEVESSKQYKNKLFILYEPNNIQNYQDAKEDEQAFKNILVCPKFCAKENDIGIKRFGKKGPVCEIKINGLDYKSKITCEMKIKGQGKEGRVGLFELKPLHGQGPTILVASHYIKKGLHKASAVKKTYRCELNIEPENKSSIHASFTFFGKGIKKAAEAKQIDSKLKPLPYIKVR